MCALLSADPLYLALPRPCQLCRISPYVTQLADDPDPSVKNGAELLDRLIKDIVTEKATFDVTAFIPLLSERVHSVKPHVRQVCPPHVYVYGAC